MKGIWFPSDFLSCKLYRFTKRGVKRLNKMIKKLLMSGMALAMSLTMMQSGGASFVSVNAQEQNEWITEQTEGQEPETVETVPLSDEELPDLEDIRSLLSPQAIVESAVVAVQTGESRDLLNMVDYDAASVDVRILENNVNWSVPGSYKATYRVDVKNIPVSYRTTVTIRVMEPETAAEKTVEAAEEDSSEEADPDEADADLPAMLAGSTTAKITRGNYYGYGTHGMGSSSWGTYQYYIDGKPAYCIEAQKQGTANGSGDLTVINNDKLLKTFYYGYNGPGAAYGINKFSSWSVGQKFIVTHCAASNAYNGNGYAYLSTDGIEMVQQFEKLVAGLETPSHTISLSSTDLKGVRENTVLKTPVITLNGFEFNTVAVELPAGVTMYKSDGTKVGTGTVKISGGQKFYLEKNLAETQTADTIHFTGSVNHSYANHVVKTDPSIQDFGRLAEQTVAPGTAVLNVTWPAETQSLELTKIWKDANDQDGIRPESVQVDLIRSDTGAVQQTVTITAASGWKAQINDLPKFNAKGEEITYTLREHNVEGYVSSIKGTSIENSHAVLKRSLPVSKIWNDDEDRDGLRPESVLIKLFADGTDTGKSLMLSAANGWEGVFEDLDVNAAGKEIVYTVQEASVPGYEAIITGSMTGGFQIQNRHEILMRPFEGLKIWDESMGASRPESITVHLHANGERIDTKTVTPDENGDWKYSFDSRPVYENGEEIEYALVEEHVGDYTASYEGMTIRNTYDPGKRTVSVFKVWEDAEDQDGLRPESVEVELLKNGQKTGITAILNEANGWHHQFTDLDEYDLGQNAQKVLNVYTVAEITEVSGYVTSYEGDMNRGIRIMNRHETETVEIQVSKVWEDKNDQDGVRPDSIELILFADGVEIDRATVAGEDWSHTFTDLPKYRDHGQEILYTVVESDVNDYVAGYETEKTESGMQVTITNRHDVELTSLPVLKVWQDGDDQDGLRPGSVRVELLSDGQKTGQTAVLSQENGWFFTFEDLDRYAAGKEILYTVEEVTVEGYETDYILEDGMIQVVNTHDPELTEVSGSKNWEDAEDQDSVRPESITIHLVADGEIVETRIVSEEDDWSWTFEALPKYEQGREILYAIMEEGVDGYSAETDGYDLINRRTPDQTSVFVTKSWKDSNDSRKIRPDQVTVELYANGEATGQTLVLSEENHWTAAFQDLALNQEGRPVEYTIVEQEVKGYTSTVKGDAQSGFTVVNTIDPERPATGASSNGTGAETQIELWTGAAFLSLVAASVLRRRRK